jgi:hypothetical protein
MSMTIRNCEVSSFATSLGCLRLTLYDIEDDGLGALLAHWDGEDLHIHNCPSFNDDVLETMTNTYTDDVSAPCMTKLTISDCPNFSVAALRELVDCRSKGPLGGDPGDEGWYEGNMDDYDMSPIKQLVVSGSGPTISREDSLWFKANLDVFQWNTRLSEVGDES